MSSQVPQREIAKKGERTTKKRKPMRRTAKGKKSSSDCPIMKSARNEPCTMRMPWCNHDPSTTVFCHIRAFGSGGMGSKPINLHGWYGCSDCHQREKEAGWDDVLRALMETLRILLIKGLIQIP